MRRLFAIFVILVAASAPACSSSAYKKPDMQEIGNWGLGWSLRGAHNRLTGAYPAIVSLLRQQYPKVREVEPSAALRQRFRDEFDAITGTDRQILQNRFLGAFTVEGLGCAGQAYVVHDQGGPVGMFVALEASSFAGSGPLRWCDGNGAKNIAAYILSSMRSNLLGLPG